MSGGRRLGGKRIFLIHGTDTISRDRLSAALTDCGFEVVILNKQKVTGAETIIEKFERIARTCNYAVALMTPDDKTLEELSGDEKFRARQNVLIELGWFMAHIGRVKTYIVVAGSIDMPSDIVGIEVYRCGPRLRKGCQKLRRFFSGAANA